VCLDTPTGSCCTACTEGDDDFGYEPSECDLARTIREEYEQFWYQVSTEGVADRSRQEAEHE
jgi:hypothetical protein